MEQCGKENSSSWISCLAHHPRLPSCDWLRWGEERRERAVEEEEEAEGRGCWCSVGPVEAWKWAAHPRISTGRCLSRLGLSFMKPLLLLLAPNISSSTFAILLIGIMINIPCVNSSGRVQFALDRYENPAGQIADGQCCSTGTISTCPGTCNTFLKFCLKSYSSHLDFYDDENVEEINSESCPLGSITTGYIAPSTQISANASQIISIPFQFTWPGSMSFVVEAKHEDQIYDTEDLIMRRTKSFEALDPEMEWSKPIQFSIGFEQPNRHIALTLRVRVICDEHYYGPRCEKMCRPKLEGKFGRYSCGPTGEKVCMYGWRGVLCDIPVCSPQCINGDCIAPDTCRCTIGWKGYKCDECIPYEGCVHGTCTVPFTCECEERWGGAQCQNDLDYCFHHSPCRNGATCSPNGANNYTCECLPGTEGRDCERTTSPCTLNPCQNFGTCVVTSEKGLDYMCVCPKGYAGKHCDSYAEVDNTGATDFKTAGSCFYHGSYYRNGARWETLDCRECQCSNSRLNCTEAQCYIGDCQDFATTRFSSKRSLSRDNRQLNSNGCMKDQICHSILSGVCLKGPCHWPYGQCEPWELLEDEHIPKRCKLELDERQNTNRCSRFYIGFDLNRIPKGTTVGRVCFHITLMMLTKKLHYFRADCRLVYGYDNVLEVDLSSVHTEWPVTGLKEALTTSLLQNLTASPLLRAATFVVDNFDASTRPAHWTANEKQQKKAPATTAKPESSTKSLVLVLSIPISLAFLIVILVISLCLLRRRIRRQTTRRSNTQGKSQKQGEEDKNRNRIPSAISVVESSGKKSNKEPCIFYLNNLNPCGPSFANYRPDPTKLSAVHIPSLSAASKEKNHHISREILAGFPEETLGSQQILDENARNELYESSAPPTSESISHRKDNNIQSQQRGSSPVTHSDDHRNADSRQSSNPEIHGRVSARASDSTNVLPGQRNTCVCSGSCQCGENMLTTV